MKLETVEKCLILTAALATIVSALVMCLQLASAQTQPLAQATPTELCIK